jgi:hypothetical protein
MEVVMRQIVAGLWGMIAFIVLVTAAPQPVRTTTH